MGNYKFRFSDMIPNAWFYKLRDMNYRHKSHHKTSNPTNKKHTPSSFSSSSSSSSSSVAATLNHPDKPHQSDQRKSYYFSRDLSFHPNSPTVEPPRKSARRRRSTKRNRRPPPRIVSSSISGGCSCRATVEEECANSPLDQTSSSDHESVLTECGSDRGLTPDTFDEMLSWSIPCKCRTENETVIDVDDNKPFNGTGFNGDHLPPIITKKHEPTKIQRTSAEFSETNKYGSLSVKVVKEDFLIKDQHKTVTPNPARRFSVNSSSPGMKLRTNSPRIGNRRIQSGRKSVSSTGSRRSVSESFAVVKSSKDPHRDFRESMVEMIVENNIKASKDLEELLACYLSLNSDEYHDLIINVFKQIWFDFIHVRLK